MRILFILDPLKKLDPVWDNSLALAREFSKRGHAVWAADAGDLVETKGLVQARAKKLVPTSEGYQTGKIEIFRLSDFNRILIRKEPPVNQDYFRMLARIEKGARKVPVLNPPRAIRENNEKLSILRFPAFIPKTLVASSPKSLLRFRKEIDGRVVIKPLTEKGGKGVFLLPANNGLAARRLQQAFRQYPLLMAQEFIAVNRRQGGEKRILLMGGEPFVAYERRAKQGEFRGNLGLGGTFHRSPITPAEKKLIAALKPYLLREKLGFVGIDTLNGKLLEINVTSPAGVTEARVLYPRVDWVGAWADFVEGL